MHIPRKLFVCLGLLLGSLCFIRTAAADQSPVRHVLLISVDGMHSLDFANYVKNNPNSTMAKLASNGWNYTAAETTKPSDSIPSTVGIFTGATPAAAGMYYDDAYHRGWSPPGSKCATVGTVIDLKQGIDIDPNDQFGGGGIDPAKLPLDPAKGCTPVYPHNMLRVNTVFEVIKAARMRTAYSEKRPAYEFLHGPSGKGVDDLFLPEIAFNNALASVALTEAFDDLRVTSILNEINGFDSSGKTRVPVPAIFGMNFQAINAAKKDAPGGYLDNFSTPTPNLQGALDHTDQALGKMVAALTTRGLLSSTVIILTAKHGETALDPNHRQIVLTNVVPNIVNGVQAGLAKKVTQKTTALVWLSDQTKTNAAVTALTLPANQTAAGIAQVLSGESLKLLFPDPLVDPAVPDIFVWTNTGVNAEPSLTSTTLAEHGGFTENDVHVPLVMSYFGLPAKQIRTPVKTTQIAPTVLVLLGLDPYDLDAVRLEGTEVLPVVLGTKGSSSFIKLKKDD
jgi:hypothetical protein